VALNALLALLLLAQVPIPSTVVPPTAERTIVFQDRGRTYVVGADSGKVIFLDTSPAPNPTPDDDDVVPPPVPPIVDKPDFVSLIVEPDNGTQAAWRTSPAVRKAIADKGAKFRSYLSTEVDIDRLGFRSPITESGLPLLIFQKANGEIIGTRKVTSETEVLEALK
jgi:hypothetical protein